MKVNLSLHLPPQVVQIVRPLLKKSDRFHYQFPPHTFDKIVDGTNHIGEYFVTMDVDSEDDIRITQLHYFLRGVLVCYGVLAFEQVQES